MQREGESSEVEAGGSGHVERGGRGGVPRGAERREVRVPRGKRDKREVR